MRRLGYIRGMSTYKRLREPSINCSHIGIHSPLLLRVDTYWDQGSLSLIEREGQYPVIHGEGDYSHRNAELAFSYMLFSLRYFIEHHFMQSEPTLRQYSDSDHYEIDMRRPDYRMLLADNAVGEYRVLVFGKHDRERIWADLNEAHARLSEIFEVNFPPVAT